MRKRNSQEIIRIIVRIFKLSAKNSSPGLEQAIFSVACQCSTNWATLDKFGAPFSSIETYWLWHLVSHLYMLNRINPRLWYAKKHWIRMLYNVDFNVMYLPIILIRKVILRVVIFLLCEKVSRSGFELGAFGVNC